MRVHTFVRTCRPRLRTDKRTEERVAGTLNLVDLAGSERLDKSESEGQRKKEAMSINSSLSALGKVRTPPHRLAAGCRH